LIPKHCLNRSEFDSDSSPSVRNPCNHQSVTVNSVAPRADRKGQYVQSDCQSVLLCFFHFPNLFPSFPLLSFQILVSILLVPSQIFSILPPSNGGIEGMTEVILSIFILCMREREKERGGLVRGKERKGEERSVRLLRQTI